MPLHPKFLTVSFIILQLVLMLGVSITTALGLILLGSFTIYLSKRAIENSDEVLVSLLNGKILSLFVFITGVSWTGIIFLDYYSIGYSNFDTGIYANQVSIFNQTGEYYSSILAMPALGEHFTPNLLLFSPLLSILNSFLWFPILKLISFLVCPFILLHFGKNVLGTNTPLVYLAPILFCFHRYLQSTLAMEFQPSGLALPFILMAFVFAYRNQILALTGTLIFLLGFKEHLPLIWVSVGLYLSFQLRKPRDGFVISSLGIIAGIIIYTVIMPYFANGLPNSHGSRFEPLALWDSKLLLIFKALLSVGFVPLFAYKTLPALIAAFGIALISNDPLMVTFGYHYQDIGLAVLFVCFIHGIDKIRRLQLSTVLIIGLCILSMGVNAFQFVHPTYISMQKLPSEAQLESVAKLEKLRNSLDRTKELWTLNSIGPYFFDFQKLRPIIHAEPPFLKDANAQVLIPESVDTWPLRAEEIETLKSKIKDLRSHRNSR